MEWTKEQKEAIELRGKNILVAAAAGSGKTAVLVERIIRLLIEGKAEADRLLVVTFTHAAAEEMRERISLSLAKEIQKAQGSKLQHLQKQLILLPSAPISTLHSFCQTIIRQNFHLTDLPNDFRVGNEQELLLLREDTVNELFADEYEKGAEDFLRFADDFGGDERGFNKPAALILSLYEYSRSQPFPDAWLKSAADNFAPKLAKISDFPWFVTILQETQLTLESAAADNEAALNAAQEYGFEKYEAKLLQHKEQIEHAQKAAEHNDFDAIVNTFNAFNFDIGRETKADKELTQIVKDLRDCYKNSLNVLKDKYFIKKEKDALGDLYMAAPYVKELCRLTLLFAERFAVAKRERLLVDFSDLEHTALSILNEGDGTLSPSPVALNYREHFDTVTIDEYQDTNAVQEAILNLVTNPDRPNLFAVGDVKQSIYRFRLADPTLFIEKYHSYPKMGEKYRRIDLRQNFRSRAEVLAAINFVFVQLMNSRTMELDYDKAAELVPGFSYPKTELPVFDGAAELDIICRSDGDREKTFVHEARLIARRLMEIKRAKTCVYDSKKDEYRPFKWRDAVILMRSVFGKAQAILDELKAANIPAYSTGDAGYFEETEISLMLSLLSVLDNSRQDIPLAAVLTSPVAEVTQRELATLRLAMPDGDLYDTLLAANNPDKAVTNGEISRKLRHKIALFLKNLSRWRTIARDYSVSELLIILYRETGYYDYVGALPGGVLRQANLRMLIEHAAEYEETDSRSLFAFLRFVERMKNADTDLAAAKTLGDSEDVVRIMTVHKSKGLEFPVVFVAGMGTNFFFDDGEKVIFDSAGIGSYAPDHDMAYTRSTLSYNALKSRADALACAEELRILYVAMTRAREKLIMVGMTKKQKDFAARIGKLAAAANTPTASLPPNIPAAADSARCRPIAA